MIARAPALALAFAAFGARAAGPDCDGAALRAAPERASIAMLADCLSAPDPALRDDLAFSTLQRRLRAGALSAGELRALRERLSATLDAPDPDGVARPFAALALAEVARTDRIAPWMTDDERMAMVARAADFLSSIDDYRGFSDRDGWRHGVAHGADWALQLALNPGAEPPKGHLVLIGGGKRPAAVMSKFLELAGGPAARILVVPTASELPDTVASYRKELAALGATNVEGLDVRIPPDAHRESLVKEVEQAAGIFFAGGDQRRIVKALHDSPVGRAIEAAWRRGAVVGGTSAGTACMSPLMLTGEGDAKTITAKNVELWPGLGLFPGAILDQHFVARQRQNRLMSVVLEHPAYLGIGVDDQHDVVGL